MGSGNGIGRRQQATNTSYRHKFLLVYNVHCTFWNFRRRLVIALLVFVSFFLNEWQTDIQMILLFAGIGWERFGIGRNIPGLRALLEAAADCPGSGLKVSPNYKKLQKAYVAYREKRGAKSKAWLQAWAARPPEVVKTQHKDYSWLCSEAAQFLEFLQEDVDRKAICPGYW